MESEEEIVIKIGNYHRDAIRKFIPWFGKTEGEVIKELALRWIEANIADPNIIRIVEAKEAQVCKAQGCPHDSTTPPKPVSQENRGESPAERKDEGIASIPQERQGFENKLIPKFDWNKSEEKSYRTIFFIECEDGRVGISYFNFKTYTTKEAVLSIPFPVPYGYIPLSNFAGNRKAAIRMYREYLFNEAHNAEAQGVVKRDEDPEEKDTVAKREEALRHKAEINAARWKGGKREMSARTKALRDGVVAKMVLGVGADVSG